MIPSFYNTNGESGLTLFDSIKKAEGQEEKILRFFNNNKGLYTPEDIHHKIFDATTPITSVRRAITNLTKKGQLFKTDVKKMCSFGKYSYCWTIKKPD